MYLWVQTEGEDFKSHNLSNFFVPALLSSHFQIQVSKTSWWFIFLREIYALDVKYYFRIDTRCADYANLDPMIRNLIHMCLSNNFDTLGRGFLLLILVSGLLIWMQQYLWRETRFRSEALSFTHLTFFDMKTTEKYIIK